MKHAKISRGGQISIPAEIRHRWGTARLELEDRGDSVVLRPAPEDPIAAFRGIWAHGEGPDSEQLRRIAREEDREIEDRKARELWRPSSTPSR